jgi:hypothetical protein
VRSAENMVTTCSQLPSSSRLAEIANSKLEFCISVSERPRRIIRIFATDPHQGIHHITEERAEYLMDLSMTADAGEPFGYVSFIAFSANKQMIAMYADADISGKVIVCNADLSREFSRQETGELGCQQVYWCGNQCIVLAKSDKIVLVGPNENMPIEFPRSRSEAVYCVNEDDGLRVTTADSTNFLEIV